MTRELPERPLVNRSLELDLLRDYLRRVAAGTGGQAVLLLGESGVGKSRLVAELLRQLDQHDLTLISAQCIGTGAEPLLPVRSALIDFLGSTPARIRRSLTRAAPRLLDAVPFVGAFLGKLGESLLADRPLRGASLDGVYEELSRLLLGVADKHGLCLVVEDLHLADPDTLHFLSYLLRKIRSRRVLVLLTAQSERLPDSPHLAELVTRWTTAGEHVVRTLLPLERAHVGEYVRTVASLGGTVDESLIDRVFHLTGGNPYYLQETTRLLFGPGTGGPGPGPIEVPPKVGAVLRALIALATGPTRHLLDAAAVTVDTTDDIEAVTYVMEEPASVTIRAFADACRLGLMREGPAGEVSFVHALMQRTVAADLTVTLRRHLQQRAGEWCEQAGHLASAAFHFEQAGRTTDLVRTALAAASRAEQRGAFHTALSLYWRARPHLAIEDIGPPLVRAMIMLGEWGRAQEIIDQLPVADSRVRLLRCRLRFVRGEFEAARTEALAALDSQPGERTAALVELADIALYLGEFGPARQYAAQALESAADGSARVPYLTMLGVTAYFEGDIHEGQRRYAEALALVRGVPEQARDVVTETMLMGNLGNAALVRGDLVAAERLHAEALRMRREVADARGALHSLHALGRTRLAAGNRGDALALFDEADELAGSLGETLERAKLTQTRAELHLRDGEPEPAYALATRALAVFEQSGSRYDITHARLALSAAAAACGRHREAVEHGAAARAAIATGGYGLLRVLYPDVAYEYAGRVAGGIVGYACGDALGLPYENLPPTSDSDDELDALRPRGIWRAGETSDDTALTLLAAQCLAEQAGGGIPAERFLATAAAMDPPVKGAGPSTTAAIAHFQSTGEVPADAAGATNGAAMRALPAGWAVPITEPERLRDLTIELSRATHRDPDALVAACVVAACGTWALEGAGPALLLEVAREAAGAAATVVGGGERLGEELAALAAGTWLPPPAGVSMDPVETVTAVLACVTSAAPLPDAVRRAVRLGGDTDTVAALVGGLLGCRMRREEVLAALPWHHRVRLPSATELAALSDGLAQARTGQPGA